MALAKQLLVTLPTGNKILYPSLSSFCKGFNANHSAVIKAINDNRTYKGITLRYVNQNEPLEADIKFYLGTLVGFKCRLADYTDNDELIKKIFNLILTNKNKVRPQYAELLNSLQVALNFINVGEITI